MSEVNGRPIVGEICLRKKRRKRQKKLLKQLFQDYARNTTLHGLRYTTENGLHIIEKIFWLMTFTVSVALSFYLISKVWTKWTTSPVIVSFAEKHVFVHKVPFPAITICPAVKFLQSNFNYTKVQHSLDFVNQSLTVDNETLETANALNLVCDVPMMPEIGPTVDSTTIYRLFNVSVDTSDIIKSCLLGATDCEDSFKRVLTDDGICFTFNGITPQYILNMDNIQQEFNYSYITEEIRNWTVADGYIDSNDDAYPHRGQESGERPYLSLWLDDLEEEKDKLCNAVFTGYKIYLHHPSEWPQALSYYFAALPQQVSSMAIKFTMVTTSDDLKSVALNVRQCYFPDERPLKYFKIYTYNHCRLECLTNYTYESCQCVSFHMPFNDSTKICSGDRQYCAVKTNFLFSMKGSNHMKKCQCLPACNYIQYDAEIHKTIYNLEDFEEAQSRYFKAQNIVYEQERAKDAKVEIFFKEPMFMAVHRSELFGVTDFLGICGGLLGLFLGFSFLSIVEIFYFLTFRVYKTIKTDLKNEKLEKPAELFHVDSFHEKKT
ncbi:hypothetical protein ABMA28_001187 [Loxostege sticticalis]|uniref:Uncharacterized protein n=1 Tax=Loxostege sticticalis TaxID=481309 RepID=A0ABD0T4Y1_LOXSC